MLKSYYTRMSALNILPLYCNKLRIEHEYWKKLDRESYNKKIFYLNYHPDNNFSKLGIYHDDIISKGIGFVVKNDFRYYIVTCYHVVKNCYNITTKINKEEIKLNLVTYFQEFDLAILEIDCEHHKTYMSHFESNKNYNLELKIPNSSEITIKTLIGDINNENYVEFSSKKFDIVSHNVNNYLNPDIPMIQARFDIKKKYVKGISGSPVYHKDKIIGFVSFQDNETQNILIITSYMIDYAFKLLKFGIKPAILKIKGSPCKLKINDEKKYGIIIKEDVNILYNNKIKFEKDTVITKLNDHEFDEIGNIYFEDIDCYVSPETYCLLNNTRTQIINVEYVNLTTQEIKNEPVGMVDIYNNCNMSLEGYNKCMYYNNFIFMELNEAIIKNIHIDEKFNNIINNPYISNQKKIVLIDLLEPLKNTTKNKKIKEINKMYDSKYNNLILKNINNKEISCLEELEILLTEIPDNKPALLSFEADISDFINILI